jgi:hypothetical protein
VTAVGEEAPGLLEAILPTGQARLAGAHVLDEEQLAARLQHPCCLAKRRRRIGDRAEDQGEDGGVEAVVGKGKLLRRGPADLDPSPARCLCS